MYVRTYDVIPLTSSLGMIQFLADTTTLQHAIVPNQASEQATAGGHLAEAFILLRLLNIVYWLLRACASTACWTASRHT
jgi:hypothetical protein